MTAKNNFETKSYEILDKEEITQDTFLLRLRGHIPFSPGQFIEASLPHFGTITLALCSDPKEKKFFELCVRASGSTSDAIANLLPGDSLNIRGPYGNSWPAAKNLIILAGGMGLVPFRSLLYELERRTTFGKINLIAGFKSPEAVIFEPDLKKWKKKFSAQVFAEYADKDFWGAKGLITQPLEDMNIKKNSTVFLCGPEVMYQPIFDILAKKGLSDKQIYASYERRMECGIGLCQHCNCGKLLVCTDGPIFRFDKIKTELGK